MKSLIIAVSTDVQAAAAQEITGEAGLDALVIKTAPDSALAQVRQALGDGAGVVVAQGRLALALKNQPDLALVEAVLLGQDLAALIKKACALLGRDDPRVALIGHRYMFSDPEPIAALTKAEVFLYYISSAADLSLAVARARESGAEAVICEDDLCAFVQASGLLALPIGPARESLRFAIRGAARLGQVLQREKRRAQEFQSLVQYSYDAVLRLNERSEVIFANPQAEKAVGQSAQALQGQKLLEISGLIPSAALVRALESRQNAYSTVLQLGQVSYVANLTAVVFEGQNDGWILSMQEFAAIDDLDERIRQERQRRGYIARARFEDYPSRSPRMKALLEQAQTYAQYDVPILISGEPRLAKTRLAECIHNASLRRRNPFVMVDTGTMPPENQFDLLFGRRNSGDVGLVSQAHKGTLFLLDVHTLVPECQRQLLSVLRNGNFRRKDTLEPIPVSVRLICSTFTDLMELARRGEWMYQLANTLLGLTLQMPPIREIPEDIPSLLDEYMTLSCKRFKKRVSLSEEAVGHLCRYPWPFNLRDIEYFCLKAVMLANEPEISLAFVREKLLPDLEQGEKEQAAHVVADQEELLLRKALREARGSRSAAAESLGMARSTLWRKMKKYGLE